MKARGSVRTDDEILAQLYFIRRKKQEYVVSLSLDCGGRLIKRRIVTIGLINKSIAHPREVFAGPVSDMAAGIIVAHNHPSSEAGPSQADIATTQQLVAASIPLGIPLIDHYIVTPDKYFSFRQHQLIF